MLQVLNKSSHEKVGRYLNEQMRIDPNGSFILQADLDETANKSIFKRVYVGYRMLRNGFRECCRQTIRLDGTFFKLISGGALLVAIGKDNDNRMFPIAWALVDDENQRSWTWFLEILFQDMSISNGFDWSFISDQQNVCIYYNIFYYNFIM